MKFQVCAIYFPFMMNFINRKYIKIDTKFFLFFLFPFFYSCSPSIIALKHAPNFSENGLDFYISSIEKKIEKDSNNINLLTNSCRLITMKGFAFPVEKANENRFLDLDKSNQFYQQANTIFIKAIEYGDKALLLRHKNYDKWISGEMIETPNFTIQDMELLYWTAGAYAGAILSSQASPKWVIKIPIIGLLFDEAFKIEPNWENGSLYTAMISYTMIRHDFNGNREEKARDYFEKAIETSKGRDLSPYVSFAENVSIATQNKNEFSNLLYKALNIDINADKDLRLTNYINQKKAQWLLDNIDEYFY